MYKYIKQATLNLPFLGLTSRPLYLFTSSTQQPPKEHLEVIKELDPIYGKRLDKYIQKKYNLKWGQVQSLFRKKMIKVLSHSDQTLKRDPSHALSVGDIVYLPRSFAITDQALADRKSEDKDAEVKYDNDQCTLFQNMIMYEDDKFIVINKFPGIASQGGTNVKLDLDFLFNNYLNWKKAELQESYAYTPGIVHRLDKDTTGVMVLAKDKVFAAQFSNLLHSRKDIVKTYLGVVNGYPNAIEETLAKKKRQIPREDRKPESLAKMLAKSGFDKRYITISQQEDDKEKESTTRYEVLGIVRMARREDEALETSYILNPRLFPDKGISAEEMEQFFEGHQDEGVVYNSILRYEIEGGRKHQIRIHSALGLGTPLLNDRKFDANREDGIVHELLEQYHDDEIRGKDVGYIGGQKIDSEEKEVVKDGVVEKHLVSARKRGEFLFLHSSQLEFDIEGKSYKFRAGLPLHMMLYFNMVFKNESEKITRMF